MEAPVIGSYQLIDSDRVKAVRGDDYNFVFRKDSGHHARWGRTHDDDPQYSPIGPEIADIEISKDGCPGFGHGTCAYCYKENTGETAYNMSLETLCQVLDSIGPQLTQVAFGITGVRTNPDFVPMMAECRQRGIVPNFTLSGADLDDEILSAFAPLVGAVAVSYHGDVDLCLNTVERLCSAGIKQVNVHAVTADTQELVAFLCDVFARRAESQSFKLNAVVLLSLKPKGRAKQMQSISKEDLARVIEVAKALRIQLGFDSCSAPHALEIYPKELHVLIEPCESGLFSAYVDCYGLFHPCSFAEGEFKAIITNPDRDEAFMVKGIYVPGCDFLRDIWYSAPVVEWREKLLANGRACPLKFGR